MEKNPFREVVKTIRVTVHKLEPGSEDDKQLRRAGMPIKCAACENDESELAQVIVMVDQKIMLPDGLSGDYLTNPFIVLYCKGCWDSVFAQKVDLPFYQ